MQNLLEDGHYFCKIEIIIPVLHFAKTCLYINTTEKVHIYKETVDDNDFNDKHTVTQNGIFKTVASSERPEYTTPVAHKPHYMSAVGSET
jgi:hypothetical protein